jgi:hypothetical protein
MIIIFWETTYIKKNKIFRHSIHDKPVLDNKHSIKFQKENKNSQIIAGNKRLKWDKVPQEVF